MVTEVALVVCQVNVIGWPEVTLLLLAENTRVGAAAAGGFGEPEPPPEPGPEPEPDPQPVTAINVGIAAKQKRILKHVASGPILLSRDDDDCRPWLVVRHPPPRGVAEGCNVFRPKRVFSRANIPTTVPRHFSISFPCSR
jgi:hypothetical protein